jgi:hypothetical protein
MSKSAPVVEFPPSLAALCKRSDIGRRISGDERATIHTHGASKSQTCGRQLAGLPNYLEKIITIWVSETPTAQGMSFILSFTPRQLQACMIANKGLYSVLSGKDAIFWLGYLGYAFADNVCPEEINPFQVYRRLIAEIRAPKWENSRCAQ